jgi:hypothetical protein
VTHVLEHVPAAGCDAERREVAQINSVLRATSEYVHGIVDESSRMALASYWYVANTVEFSPSIGARLVGPDIVEPGDAVSATESGNTISTWWMTIGFACLQIQLVIPCDY